MERANPASDKTQTPKTAPKADGTAERNLSMPQALPGLLHGGGSEMRRRAVLHMQQMHGNRATQQMLAQRRPAEVKQRAPESVQRDFGFELETNWRIYDYDPTQNGNQAALTNPQKTTAFPFYAAPPYVNNNLTKGQGILGSNRFEMQVDELPTGGKDIEFVSSLPPFPETGPGRVALDNTLTALDGLATDMVNSPFANMQPADLANHGAQLHDAVIKKNPAGLNASPQVTAAIRLDQIEELFTTAGTPTGAGADATKNTTRQKLSNVPSGGTGTNAESIIMGDAPGQAHAAVNTYQTSLLTSKRKSKKTFGQAVGSAKLIGLMSLIITYLKIGASGKPSYAKQIAPLLARTNFAHMFTTLPQNEATYFSNNPKEWTKLNLDAAGFTGGGSQPVLPLGVASHVNNNILKRITREKWLRQMTKGTDILSQAGYDAKFGANKGGAELESMGRLGNKMENVGGNNPTTAPVFEMRRMKGSVPYTDWHQLILDAFDYVRAVNEKQNAPRM